METTKKELIFDGNEKRVYATSDPGTVVFHFKDVATAFNNVKTAVFPRKGIVNNKISALIFDYLGKNGIYTHYIYTIKDREQLCRKRENIPREVVVRNYIAGSLSDRLGIEEGTKPSTVIYDLNYNNSDLGDPLINDTQAVALGIVSFEDLKYIYAVAAKVNDLLLSLFTPLGIKLVDFKLEFGRDTNGKIMLVDEISPDTSRFWDAATDKRLDKDRFRHDMGYIVASYEEVLNRLLSVQESQQ